MKFRFFNDLYQDYQYWGNVDGVIIPPQDLIENDLELSNIINNSEVVHKELDIDSISNNMQIIYIDGGRIVNQISIMGSNQTTSLFIAD